MQQNGKSSQPAIPAYMGVTQDKMIVSKRPYQKPCSQNWITGRVNSAQWKIEHNDYWKGQMIHISQAELEDGDHMRLDEQDYDNWKENE